jgi:aspartate/methionine/tyrosine aminotransferase
VDGNTRVVLVNTPHNPTGSVLSDAEMETLHDFCADRGIQFVCDQVYHPIYHGAETRSAARLPHATVLGDFSKALCLSGLRVGWIVERDAARRALYRNARSHFTVCNTVLGERLAVLALRHSEAIYGRVREVTERNLGLLDLVMKESQDLLGWIRPKGGMIALAWLTGQADAREFCCRLAARGVLIVPGDCFGMPEYFRLGFGTSKDGFSTAISRFAEFLRSEARHLSLVQVAGCTLV